MAHTHTHLDLTIRLHLSGNVLLTTAALTDPPRPELTSLSVEGLSYVGGEMVEGLDGVRHWAERLINLTPQSPTEDRYLRFLENLLTALNGEAEEALVDSYEGGA